jgi:hypothetical protein
MKVLSFDMEIGQIQEQRPIFIPGMRISQDDGRSFHGMTADRFTG